jgi:endonuclease/exonuclease/phosphatase family metal-dependent hydrolase
MCKWPTVVLGLLASVLACGSAPVRAADDDGDLDRHEVRVLSQNMYIGASLGNLVSGAETPQDIVNDIIATKPAERAAAMAAEIAKQRPDLVALHEAWRLTVGRVIVEDLLQSVIDELKALGQPYELACAANVCGTVNDEDVVATCGVLPIHLTDRDAILKRTDVDIHIIDVQSKQFTATITTPLPPPCTPNSITSQAGYVWVDAIVRGLPLRFVSVHLIPNPTTIGLHTAELLKNEATTTTLVLGGDFNTTADDPSNLITGLVYRMLITPQTRLTDAWELLHPSQPGFTCCQEPNLLNTRSNLDLPPCPPGSTVPPPGRTACPHRIDLILFRGLAGVSNMKVFGDKPQTDRTPSGLWPSDHAGIVATLAGPDSQQFIANK